MRNLKLFKIIFFPLVIMVILLLYLFFINESEFKGEPLHLKKILSFGNSFGRPIQLCIIDSPVLVIDQKPLKGFKFIQAFSINGNFLYSFGDRGSGPNEMISPKKIDIDPTDKGYYWIFDGSLLRLTRFTLSDKRNNDKFIKLDKGMPYDPVIISDNLIASLGFGLTSGRFALFDSTGRLLDEVGQIPPGQPNNTPIPVHLVAFQGTMCKNSDASKIIISSLYSDMIEIYTSEGKLIKRFYGPDEKLPIYKTVKVGVHPVMEIDLKKSYFGYLSIYSTSNKIYALYSETSITDRKKGGLGNIIHVYDFDGKLLKIYKTDEDLYAISINANDSLLFGIQHYDRVSIIKYKL